MMENKKICRELENFIISNQNEFSPQAIEILYNVNIIKLKKFIIQSFIGR